MNRHNRQVYIVEEFIVIFDRHTGAEEDHDFFLSVFLQECEEKEEPFFHRTYNITLKKERKDQIIHY
jgi:hypothetical protein